MISKSCLRLTVWVEAKQNNMINPLCPVFFKTLSALPFELGMVGLFRFIITKMQSREIEQPSFIVFPNQLRVGKDYQIQ